MIVNRGGSIGFERSGIAADIIIDDAPDGLTPQIEQFQSLVELKKFDTAGEIPFRAIVCAMPNLKDKQAFLKDMDEQAARKAQAAQSAQAEQAQQGLQALQRRGAEAEVAETESKAALNFAKAREVEQQRAAQAMQAMAPSLAGHVGAHHAHGRPKPDDSVAHAAKGCGGNCSCSDCA